ncbi:hypothetical protein COV05_02795 [Candidatus Uhrbacteria bacterium CG10_big_fil_rev_8_21_14_0_10_48_16]|uniref:Uncharacterized protein n=1 Tax=Candidatus Uhrbacteria bacterium CG10_big_fil_rev_8_21_14_0_10_48_16 TaxID=1975038 RepID=A0A2M8LH46_9BACT|nr:MAG: hypothetical protein COV05_02795 [Candidatus Uhrbacteria bacterium CG10_big_fil_rev_8_21_14_0_10_48_16]
MFRFFGRGPEGPSHETVPTQPKKSVESSKEGKKSNEEIMVDAIAENMWDLGMTAGMEGTPEERKAVAREMAEEALSLAPAKYKTLPTQELQTNKSFLVAEAIRLYTDAESEREKREEGVDENDHAEAAK